VGLDAKSLERLVPDELVPGDLTGGESLRISLERYEFAARHSRAGRLLDVACGVGYGTRLLADRCAGRVEALGIDLSPEAIDHARRRYAGASAHFAVADAMEFHDPEGFDTIVSIETIEHLPAPEAFVAGLVRMLRPAGVLVASVPTTPSVDANPHHLHDFSERSFRRLLAPHGLVERDALAQDQPFELGRILARGEPRLGGLRRGLPAWYARHPGALARRIAATLRYGFRNRYLTLALQAPA
jgi:SAM-dependent methyltransferase